MYIGRYFKRDIELDSSKIYTSKLKPNRSWLDLFSLSLSNCFYYYKFDFTNLRDNLSENEVIVIDSHDDIFKDYQIHFWRKDRISDILPAIKCPSFKSETKIFKTSEMEEMRKFIYDQNHTKSIVIENTDEEVSISLVYGNTIKIGPNTFNSDQKTNLLEKLQEKYWLWEIDECACKPKKIRVLADDFEKLKYVIGELESISNTNDVKLGMHINSKYYSQFFYNYHIMIFSHSARLKKDSTKFTFSGDSLVVVSKGSSYNFRLDERIKESEDSYIKGKI